jgi:hypothetical protein
MKPYWETLRSPRYDWAVYWCFYIFLALIIIDGDWAKLHPSLAVTLIVLGIVPSFIFDVQWRKIKRRKWEEINDHIEYVVATRLAEYEDRKAGSNE